MRKKILIPIFIFVLLVCIFSVTSETPDSVRGSFNRVTCEINWCDDPGGCKHERGHVEDCICAGEEKRLEDFCHNDPEFKELVDAIHEIGADSPYVAKLIRNFPGIGDNPKMKCYNIGYRCFWEGGWGGYLELWAEVYKWKPTGQSIIDYLEGLLEEISILED